MGNTPKCPNCGEQVPKARIEKIETDTVTTDLMGPLPRAGLVFVCPNPACNVILPIWPVPSDR